jgi:hypothetical protein
MSVTIASKTDLSGSITPSGLSSETTIVAPGAQADDYIAEGWVDLSNMQAGDTVVLTEYVSVDGVNYRQNGQGTYTGAQSGGANPPIQHFTCKTFFAGSIGGAKGGMLYKVTVNQTGGTVRAFPYSFAVQVMSG